jgi:hypothetical protein
MVWGAQRAECGALATVLKTLFNTTRLTCLQAAAAAFGKSKAAKQPLDSMESLCLKIMDNLMFNRDGFHA